MYNFCVQPVDNSVDKIVHDRPQLTQPQALAIPHASFFPKFFRTQQPFLHSQIHSFSQAMVQQLPLVNRICTHLPRPLLLPLLFN